MPTFDSAIINGTVVTPHGQEQLSILIKDGKIRALLPPDTPFEAREIIDARHHLVIPGAIDIHFHCRAPAYPQRGDFATETRAAAAGGVTTIFEMPISKPCCATGDIFRRRKALGEANAYVNFGLSSSTSVCMARRVCSNALKSRTWQRKGPLATRSL